MSVSKARQLDLVEALGDLRQAWTVLEQKLKAIERALAVPNGRDCYNCGMSDKACYERVVERRAPCCGRCRSTATHGQNEPNYTHPRPTA